MDPNEKKRKLITSSEFADPSLSQMDLKKKSKRKKKKQKVNNSIVLASLSLSKKDVKEAMKKQNDVAMFLTGQVIATVARNSNFVFSPASINALLTMVVASCSREEETLRSFILSILKSSSIDELNAVFREIATFVLVDGSKRGGPKIAAVNGVWIEESISVNPSLKDLFENIFKAAFHRVDFRSKGEQVRLEANKWASNHTNGLIKDLLPHGSVKRETDWFYGNALYFKGAWENKFDKFFTKDKKFHLLNGNSVSVPFMGSYKEKYFVRAYDGFKVLQLPFRQGGDSIKNCGFSMYFYLSDKRDGLDDLVERIASTSGFLDSHIPSYKVQVGELTIPKFKIEFGFEASKVFVDLELDVSLYHKAWIEIDEDGAEAASFSAFRRPYCGCAKMIDFVANHPFFFLIRENKTGTVLFSGQIVDPSKST